MRRLILFVLTITLILFMAACSNTTTDAPGPGIKSSPSPSPLAIAAPKGSETAPPQATPAPRVFAPEELLSAKDVESFVGQPVQASFDPVEVSQTGSSSGSYVYDIPLEGIDVTDTFSTFLYLTQNGLILPSELAKGHDAKWTFEDFRKTYSDKTVDISGFGGKAFYMSNNSDVHVLFQDYYFIVIFRIDSTDFDKNLELNKSIASFIIDKLSLADVSLTSPE